MHPTAEKAQQLPHIPWFFTSVTAPFCLQSQDVGLAAFCSRLALAVGFRRFSLRCDFFGAIEQWGEARLVLCAPA